MSIYVVALTDTPVGKERSGDRAVHTVGTKGVYAVCERRTTLPSVTDEELRAQHTLVLDIARRVGAILPVRFGTLMDKPELLTFLREHREEITRSLAEVRGRVQMTLRITGRRRQVHRPAPSSGREYLERRRQATAPVVPRRARALLASLTPIVARERLEPGAGDLLATVYHLIESADVPRYTRTVQKAARPGTIMTGPWPPFAFTPKLT